MSDSTYEVLKIQLKNGASQGADFGDIPTAVSEKEFLSTVPILKRELSKNGFKKPDKISFERKIKDIFHLVVSREIEHISILAQDRCKKISDPYHAELAEIYHIHVICNESFITNQFFLPEIIHYEKEYPELNAMESNLPTELNDEYGNTILITRWKDLTDLPQQRKENIQTLVARNKYLFNDSKADLPYLLHNDQDFLKALVVVFGYDKEPKINELVMRDYEERNHLQHREEIGDILFVKNCEGKLEIRQGLLEYIARRTQSEEKRLADALYSFIVTYLEDKPQFTPAEKRKIVAYAAQTYEPLYERFYKIGWPMGSMLMMYLQSDEGAAEEFRKNRYYGLPDLQRYTEQALWQIRAESIQPDVQEQDE